MRHKKGNISIFVIFILLASSLLGLLSLLFIQKLLRYQNIAIKYYQSYYSAKAGLEIALALHKIRGVGFSYTIPLQQLLTENMTCGDACQAQADITARSSFAQDNYRTATKCTTGIALSSGESKIIPLFYDDGTGDLYGLFSQTPTYTSLVDNMHKQLAFDPVGLSLPVQRLIVGMFVLSGNSLLSNGSFLQEYNHVSITNILPTFRTAYDTYVGSNQNLQDTSMQQYLLLANAGNDIIHICLSLGTNHYDITKKYGTFSQESVVMRSMSALGNYRVGLQAILDASIPQYLLQTYVNL